MKKFLIIVAIIIGLALIGSVYFYKQYPKPAKIDFGLTYSTKAAEGLGFDYKQEYLDILNDLKPQKIRLISYWDELEPQQGQYNFQKMDELLAEADKRNISVILVLGHKEPRWPECHQPDWFNSLSKSDQNQAVLDMLSKSVQHYSKFTSIKTWQIENEPFFGFGPECGKIDSDLLKQEVAAVKNLDDRPVMVTDSGEKGGWATSAKIADVLGVTMYRVVVDKWFGYEKYPIPPAFYRIKAGMIEKFVGSKPIVGVELQAEPWVITGFAQVDLKEQLSIMNPKVLQENVDYAKAAGFQDNYLWGVEWWYWLAKDKNDWGMWNTAKEVINRN